MTPFLPESALTNEGFVAFMPHLHQADAFFIAVLKIKAIRPQRKKEEIP